MSDFLLLIDPASGDDVWSNIHTALQENDGRALYGLTPNIWVAEGEDAAQAAVTNLAGVSAVFAGLVPPEMDGDPLNITMGHAWNFLQSPEFAQALADAAEHTLPWENYTAGALCLPPSAALLGDQLDADPGHGGFPPFPPYIPGTNSRLDSNIALRVVIVDGPAGTSAAFFPLEKLLVTVSVLDGLSLLQKSAPPSAHLFIMTEYTELTLGLPPESVPAPSCLPEEKFNDMFLIEPLWRDPALAAMIFPAGTEGVRDLTNEMRQRVWFGNIHPQWAYVIFVTKYNCGYFAYTSTSRLWATIQFTQLTNGYCGGPGIPWANLGRVIAHETSHIFGALDEYAPCSTLAVSGESATPNENCVVDNPASVPCLMRGDSDVMCPSSRGQVGWANI